MSRGDPPSSRWCRTSAACRAAATIPPRPPRHDGWRPGLGRTDLIRWPSCFPDTRINLIFGHHRDQRGIVRPPSGRRPRPRHSIGWPIAGNEFRLLGSVARFRHAPCPRSRHDRRYHNNPEQMAKRFDADGWFNTDDRHCVAMKSAGSISSAVPTTCSPSSGHNIYPAEVELGAGAPPRHRAGRGRAGARRDQALRALRLPGEAHRLDPLAEEGQEEVKQYALENAPPYQYPRKVVFPPSSRLLPMTGVGKIDSAASSEAEARQRRGRGRRRKVVRA